MYSGFHASTAISDHPVTTHDAVKHVALGGFWYDAKKKTWRSAGHGARDYMRDHPEEKAHLGYQETKPVISGSGHLPKSQQRHSMSVTWAQMYSSTVISSSPSAQLAAHGLDTQRYFKVESMTLITAIKLSLGKIFLLSMVIISTCLHLFKIEDKRHEKLQVPRLTLTQDTALLMLQLTARITTPITPAAFNVSDIMTQPLPDSRVVTAQPFETPQQSSVKRGAKRKVTEMDKQAGGGFQANSIASSFQSQNCESYTGAAYANSQWQCSFSWPAAGPHISESGPPFPPPFTPPPFLSLFSPHPPPVALPPFLPPFSPHLTHAMNMQTSLPPLHPSHTNDMPVADCNPPYPSVPSQSFNYFSRWTCTAPFGPGNDSSNIYPKLRPEQKKQALTSVRSRCIEYHLNKNAADDFRQIVSARLQQQSIEIFVLLKAQLLAKSEKTLLSKFYKAHVTDQVLVCITCLSVPAYLKNAVDNIMNFIKDLPEWFKLDRVTLHPIKVEDNSDHYIKATIAASLVSSADKNKPCIGGQDIMALHRLLALHSLCSAGTSSVARSSKKNENYWKYVDDKLQKATVQIKAKSTLDAQAATMLKEYFDHCFKANLCMFAILPIQWAIEKFMACVVV
ncbi:hypothetical protein BC835DRAFT_1310052 [Cytidiella melzeri]|nr:hypothetical protein BC835DRAFT_1310052 [Cytidiella melzeri]